MVMENSKVKFRRGNVSDFPEQVTDGYFNLDTEKGYLFTDVVDDKGIHRTLINGTPYGVCVSNREETDKIVEIDGVDRYFDGLTVMVSFSELGDDDSQIRISIVSFGKALDFRKVVSSDGSPVSSSDIATGTPYMLTYSNGVFVVTSSGSPSGLRWMPI